MQKYIVIAVILLIVVGGIYIERQRGNNLSGLAEKLGFSYKSGSQPTPAALLSMSFDLLTQGAPLIDNKMEGMFKGNAIAVFDYSYDARMSGEGSGSQPVDEDHTDVERRTQSVVWVKSQLQLPEFDVSPTKGHMRKVAGRFGFSMLSIETDKNFESEYTLLVKDPVACRELFNGTVREQLLGTGIVIESRGSDFLIYRFSQRLKATKTEEFLEQAVSLVKLLEQASGL